MNIGIFVSPRHSVPSSDSQHNMAWDTAGFLADGLVQNQHSVVLFASRGSTTKARLVDLDYDSLDRARESLSPAAYRQLVAETEHRMFGAVIEAASREHLDILHIHEPTESLADLV